MNPPSHVSGAAPPKDEIRAALICHRGGLRSIGAFSAVINLLMLVPALYMLQVYDRVLASGNEFTLLMLTLIAIGLLALMGAMEYVRSLTVIQIGSRFDVLLGARVHQAAFERGLAGGQASAGQAINDLNALRQFLTGNAVFAFFDAPWFPLYLLVMYLFHPWLGVLATVGAALLIALAWLNEWLSRRPLAEAGTLSVRANASVEGQLRNVDAIESMGMLGRLLRRWRVMHRGYVWRQALASERTALISAISKSLRIALQSLVLGLGAWLAIEGRISPGMMIAGSILMGRVLSPIDMVITAWRQWSGTRLAYQRLKTLLDEHPLRAQGLPLPPPSGVLRFEGVTAVPPGAQLPSVVNLSFELPAGEVLGVIGPSGSGKSTLARLMVGVWRARIGKVRLDGGDIQQWERERLGEYIGYLPQDVELFAGTVAENISRFAEPGDEPDADAARVVAAARLAGAHELVLSLPQGYDTPLGVGGLGLSGGQRQRIALARALYGPPRLLVLDEPNASLDEAGETALLEALARLREQGVSVVVITHRPKVLAATTRLLVLKAGQLQLSGATQEVLARLRGNGAGSQQKVTPMGAAAGSYQMASVTLGGRTPGAQE